MPPAMPHSALASCQRRAVCAALGGALLTLAALPPAAQAQAQGYPAKPVRLIVPAAPGGGLDVLSRLVAGKLSTYWGQQLVVENRPGAGMALGTGAAAKAAPDGYTALFVNDGGLVINPLVTRTATYSHQDFAPVGLWVTAPLIVTVHDALPVKSLAQLLDHLRANPGKLNFAVADDNARLYSELLKTLAKVDYAHVPYKGAGPATQALMAGEADFSIMDPVAATNAAKSGRVRLLAVTSAQRSKGLPDLPTSSEAGLPGYVAGTWGGMLVPVGTPAAVIAKLNADARRALAEPDVIARFEAFSLEVRPSSPDELAQRIRADHDKWDKLIKDQGLKFGE